MNIKDFYNFRIKAMDRDIKHLIEKNKSDLIAAIEGVVHSAFTGKNQPDNIKYNPQAQFFEFTWEVYRPYAIHAAVTGTGFYTPEEAMQYLNEWINQQTYPNDATYKKAYTLTESCFDMIQSELKPIELYCNRIGLVTDKKQTFLKAQFSLFLDQNQLDKLKPLYGNDLWGTCIHRAKTYSDNKAPQLAEQTLKVYSEQIITSLEDDTWDIYCTSAFPPSQRKFRIEKEFSIPHSDLLHMCFIRPEKLEGTATDQTAEGIFQAKALKIVKQRLTESGAIGHIEDLNISVEPYSLVDNNNKYRKFKVVLYI